MNVTNKTTSQGRCDAWREAIRTELVEGMLPAGLKQHLEECAQCRAYAADVRIAVSGLSALAQSPVEASPAFHQRWRQQVLETHAPARPREPIASPFAKLTETLLRLLRANWAPALGLGMVWLTILILRSDLPAQRHADSPAATGPLEIAHFLRVERQFFATRFNSLPL